MGEIERIDNRPLPPVPFQFQVLPVTNSIEAIEASGRIAMVAKYIAAVHEREDPKVDRWHQGHKAACADRKILLDPAETFTKSETNAIGAWRADNRRKAEVEAQRVAAIEQARLEKEQRAAQEAAEIQSAAAMQIAEEAEAEGDDATAKKALAMAMEQEKVATTPLAPIAPVVVAPVAAPSVAGMSGVTKWHASVIDIAALIDGLADSRVPRYIISGDVLDALNKMLSKQAQIIKGDLGFPGVKCWSEESLRRSGGRF